MVNEDKGGRERRGTGREREDMSLYLVAHAVLDLAPAKPSSPWIRGGVDDIRGSEREASPEVGSHQGGQKG